MLQVSARPNFEIILCCQTQNLNLNPQKPSQPPTPTPSTTLLFTQESFRNFLQPKQIQIPSAYLIALLGCDPPPPKRSPTFSTRKPGLPFFAFTHHLHPLRPPTWLKSRPLAGSKKQTTNSQQSPSPVRRSPLFCLAWRCSGLSTDSLTCFLPHG